MARYDAGETLASIARTYDCSPPAISYVVSRSRARQPARSKSIAAANPVVPQLIKTAATDGPGAPAAVQSPPETPPPEEMNGSASLGNGAASGAGNGADGGAGGSIRRPPAAASVAANADHRGTLHLSLGGPPHSSGGARGAERPVLETENPGPRPEPALSAPERGGNGSASRFYPGERRAAEPAPHNGGDPGTRRDGTPFIDRELRMRVEADIDAFLAAFDAALEEDSPEHRSALREATDRLLRAGARTRIELERLEARLPLPPREGAGRGNSAWRDR
jgi:hypothetical protein